MSKLIDLLKGSGRGGNDAIRRTTTETMAHLLERNRKFEAFLVEKLAELEKRITPKLTDDPGDDAALGTDDEFFDFFNDDDLLGEDENAPKGSIEEPVAAEPLVMSRSFGDGDRPSLSSDDESGNGEANAVSESDQSNADTAEDADTEVDNWMDVFGDEDAAPEETLPDAPFAFWSDHLEG